MHSIQRLNFYLWKQKYHITPQNTFILSFEPLFSLSFVGNRFMFDKSIRNFFFTNNLKTE